MSIESTTHNSATAKLYTLAEARFILSHVYCVHHVPEGDGWTYQWGQGFGEGICCRCDCRDPADLRLHVASEATAAAWLAKENAFIQLMNSSKAS
jgi:hypothetical protein